MGEWTVGAGPLRSPSCDLRALPGSRMTCMGAYQGAQQFRPSSACGGTGTELAGIRLQEACEALDQYPQWESDPSGHGSPEVPGMLAGTLEPLAELAEGLRSSAGWGPASAVSS